MRRPPPLERQRELDDRMAEIARIQSEMTGRMQTIGEVFGSRQADLVRLFAERLDSLQSRRRRRAARQRQADHRQSRQAERAPRGHRRRAEEPDRSHRARFSRLKDVLANKQTRGAFGQGRMEAIVRDALPQSAYRLPDARSLNGTRPDCIIHLPGDDRPLVVDAKFPLEGFTAFREAQRRGFAPRRGGACAPMLASMSATSRPNTSLPGETQDIAVLFVPAESLFADLQEHFEDVVQKAHRQRVLIVSPSLLTMAIQVMQAIVRDARMREQAHQIQAEVAAADGRRHPDARAGRQARPAFPPGAGRRCARSPPRPTRSSSAATGLSLSSLRTTIRPVQGTSSRLRSQAHPGLPNSRSSAFAFREPASSPSVLPGRSAGGRESRAIEAHPATERGRRIDRQ